MFHFSRTLQYLMLVVINKCFSIRFLAKTQSTSSRRNIAYFSFPPPFSATDPAHHRRLGSCTTAVLPFPRPPPFWHHSPTRSTCLLLPRLPIAWPTCPACPNPPWSCCTDRQKRQTRCLKVTPHPGWRQRRGRRKKERRRRWYLKRREILR